MLEYIIPLFPQILWATNFVVSKVIVSKGLHPLLLTALRWSVAGSLLYLYVRLRGLRIVLSKELIVPAATGIAGFSALIYLALLFSKSSVVGLTMAFIPIFTALLASLILKERLGKLTKFAIVIGFVGGIILSGEKLGTLNFLGALLGILAAFDWAVYTITSKRIMVELSAMELLASIAILAQPINWLLALPFLNFKPLEDAEVLYGLLYVSLVPGYIAYFLWLYSVKLVGASRAGIYVSSLPVFTLILSIIILGEKLSFYEALGSVLILTALALVTFEMYLEYRRRGLA